MDRFSSFRSHVRFDFPRFFPMIVIPLLLCSAPAAKAANYGPRTGTMLVRGDTTVALQALDQMISQDGDNYRALLDRGWLLLDSGSHELAEKDFRGVLFSKSDSMRISAYCGLAECSEASGKIQNHALDFIRRAMSIDSHNPEVLYTRTAILLSGDISTQVAEMAKDDLFELLETDFGYDGAYELWRDVLLDKTDDDIRHLDALLAGYLEAHPEKTDWRLDLAWNRYLVEGPGAALDELARLSDASPEFSHPDRLLLDARCKLETGDTLSFQELYWQAVDLAGRTGRFDRLLTEAAGIFTPEDQRRCERAITDGAQEQFLNFFWANVDPIKINPINLRLAEHYFRLAYVQRHYRQSQPYSQFNLNENVNRLVGFQGSEWEHMSEKITFSSGRDLGLDHRGLLYLRYGPPDLDRSHLPNENLKAKYTNSKQLISYLGNPMEVWYYNDLPFVFEKLPMAGEFISRPLAIAGIEGYMPTRGPVPQTYPPMTSGDMQKAMEMQIFPQPDIHESAEYYLAQFAAPGLDGLELEIYQDEVLPENETPTDAAVAAYDTLWYELDRSKSKFFRIPGEKDNRWVAVHTIPFPPGENRFAIKLEAGGETWNGRGWLKLVPFASEYLELSAVVLGLDPLPDGPSHERRGVRFIPRPSFSFRQGETVRVYFELNNLAARGGSTFSYREYIDVLRYEGNSGILGKITGALAGILTFGEEKEGAEIQLRFDREGNYEPGPVPETFLIDSSELLPGKYRMVIEVRDNNSQFWDDEAVMFEIVD
jgi:hypothetical protein